MLANGKRTSQIASAFIDDGDDLHITMSFRAQEDNSSTMGNASCIEPVSVSVENPYKGSDVCPTEQSELGNDDETSDLVTRDTSHPDSSGRSLRIRKLPFLRGIRKAHKLLPWRFSAFLNNPRQSLAIRQYQQMMETTDLQSPAASDVASCDETVHSVRSSRLDASNGKSMLVRQEAQVFGRPSVAQTEWDIGSSFSSDASSAESQHRIAWDNASFGAASEISRLTGDSFSSKSKRTETHRSRGMFINPLDALLVHDGSKDEEELEEEDERESTVTPNAQFFEGLQDRDHSETARTTSSISSSSHSSKLRPNTMDSSCQDPIVQFTPSDAHVVVNRLLRRNPVDIGQASAWDLFSTFSAEEFTKKSAGNDFDDSNRARIYSDSDMVFEMQRRRVASDRSFSSGDIDAFPVWAKDENIYIDGNMELDTSDMRVRSHSESFVSDRQTEAFQETFAGRSRCASDDYIGPTAAIVTKVRSLVSPHISTRLGTAPLSWQPDRKWNDRLGGKARKLNRGSEAADQIPLLGITKENMHRSVSLLDSDSSDENNPPVIPVASSHCDASIEAQRARRSSAPTALRSTIMAATAKMSETSQRLGLRQPMQPMIRLSSPTAMSAAKQIASALRPPSASVPTTNPAVFNYYWQDGSEGDDSSDVGEEVLWSLEADSFEEIF